MSNIFSPIFLFKKRKAILMRIREIPYNIYWSIIYKFIAKGFIYHKDYEKLSNMKDIYNDKIGFLMGNGPSVEIDDLEKISDDSRFIKFAANRIHLIYDNSSYRPDYVVSSDQQVIEDFGQEIIDNNREGSVFFSSFYRPNFLKREYCWIKLKNGRPFKFSNDIKRIVMSGGGSLNVALQLGYHMGIRKFYLYGVDHSFKFEKNTGKKGSEVSGDGNHFIPNYRSGKTWQAPRTDLTEETFIKLDNKLRENGGFLINATNGGKLEVLERISLNDVLKPNES